MNRIGHAIIAATLALVAGIGSTASAYDHRQDTEALRQNCPCGSRFRWPETTIGMPVIRLVSAASTSDGYSQASMMS